MNLDEDIKRYLPQYLSAAELGLLKEELAKFTEYGTRDAIYSKSPLARMAVPI